MNIFVTAALYWDPGRDVDALLDEYYKAFYGPAAAGMKDFFEFAQALWMRNERRTLDGKGYLKSEDIPALFERLERAKAAAGDTLYGRRIDLFLADLQPLHTIKASLDRPVDVPRATSIRRSAPPVIDGRLEPEFWDGVPRYKLRRLDNGKPPRQATDFHVAFTPAALCVAVVCHESDMASLAAKAAGRDNVSIWADDTVELLVETPQHSYYQFVINPLGALVDQDRARSGGQALAWDSGAQVAVSRGEKAWTIEIMIPLKNLVADMPPTENVPWFFNVCRSRPRGTGAELSAFSPTGTNQFHVLSRLGRLIRR